MIITEIIELIKENKKTAQWVLDARENSKVLKALKYGENFHEVLINRMEHIEESKRALARKKYSKDVRDLFYRVYETRDNVFFAEGGDEHYEVEGTRKEAISDKLNNFKGRKSIDSFLFNNLFQLSDVDPNGVIFMEYETNDEKINVYPTYKSIQDIRVYKSNDITADYILFEPIEDLSRKAKQWRFVDNIQDLIINELNGKFEIDEEKSFEHGFGRCPSVILSPIEKIGTETRLSWLFFIQQLAETYAIDESVMTLYKRLQGFPKHWRYKQECKKCKGTGKVDGESCSCNSKNDVTDDIIINPPKDKEMDIILAPNLSGWISPDLETLKWMQENKLSLEEIIYKTVWGVTKEKTAGGDETATGRFIDVQPVINRLNVFSKFVDDVKNELADLTINLIDPLKNKDEKIYTSKMGKRFILESYDTLIAKYNEAKEKQSSVVILDKLLSEIISSRYKSDPNMRLIESNKLSIEPYPHLTIEQVLTIFGEVEAKRKGLFHEWAKTQDFIYATEEDFNKWFNEKIKEYGSTANTETGQTV
jgi:hypothetical protein